MYSVKCIQSFVERRLQDDQRLHTLQYFCMPWCQDGINQSIECIYAKCGLRNYSLDVAIILLCWPGFIGEL